MQIMIFSTMRKMNSAIIICIVFLLFNINTMLINSSEQLYIDNIQITKQKNYPPDLLSGFDEFEIFPNDELRLTNIGDIDGDSLVDLIGSNNSHRLKIEWIPNINDFEKIPYDTLPGVQIGGSMIFEDLNGDSILDIYDSINQSLYNWKDNKLELILNNSGIEYSAEDCGDFDADGDLDIISSSGRSGFFVYRNMGNGTFTKTSMNGLIKYSGPPDIPHKSYCGEFQDINNDGWMDICSGAGDSLGWTPGPDFFWINDGDENWKNFSRGSPTYEIGREIKMSDLDNDGDKDCVMIFEDNNTLILENQYPNDWIIHNLNEKNDIDENYQDYHIQIGDLNNDGDEDIIQSFYNVKYNINEEIIGIDSIIGIYWNMGNMNFTFERSSPFNLVYPRLFPLADINLDGSLDIIISPEGHYWESLNPIVLFNNIADTEDLFIYELPKGDTLRSGTYSKIMWGSNKMNDQLNESNRFNLSISYFNISGRYQPLLRNISKWWTYWIVPDYPTNNAFIKIEGNSTEAYYGPITIYSKENQKYPVECEFDIEHNYFTSGRDIGMDLKSSNVVEDNSLIKIEIEHTKGNIGLGDYRINNSVERRIECTIPEYLHYIDARIKVTLSNATDTIEWLQDEQFNILTPYTFLERIEVVCNDSIGKGASSLFEIRPISTNGQYLTDNSEIHIQYSKQDLSLIEKAKGIYSIKGMELGYFEIKINVNCWGVSRSTVFNINIIKSLNRTIIHVNRDIVHTGEFVSINIDITDLDGDEVEITTDEIEWILIGDNEIISQNVSHINFIPLSPGIVNITCKVNFGIFTKITYQEIQVLSSLLRIDIINMSSPICTKIQNNIEIQVLNWNNKSLRDFNTSWIITGPAIINESSDIDMTFFPTSEHEIEINIIVYFLNETINKTINIFPFSPLEEIHIIYSSYFIELDSLLIVNFSLYNNINEKYHRDINLSFIFNEYILDVYNNNKSIFINGKNLGSSSIKIIAHTEKSKIIEEIFIEVYDPIKQIQLNHPMKIIQNIPTNINITFIGKTGNEIKPFDILLETNSGSIYKIINNNMIIVDKLGYVTITIEAIQYNSTITRKFLIEVIPKIDEINVVSIPKIIRRDTMYDIIFEAKLDNGEITNNFSLMSLRNDNYSIIFNNEQNQLIAYSTGIYTIELFGNYYYEELTFSVKIEVHEQPYLVSIVLYENTFKNNSILEVNAYDQYGFNITNLCVINWIGKITLLSMYKVILDDNECDVYVMLNGTKLHEKFILNKKNRNQITTYEIISLSFLLLITILSTYAITRRYRKRKPWLKNGALVEE